MNTPREFWYAIEESEQVKKGKIREVMRLGEKLILWRTSNGELVCMENRCPHRGAALSLGCVKENTIKCIYHGIEYNQEGECTHIPAHGKHGTIPKGLEIKSYTVKDSHGLIWLWWGEKRADLPPISWFDEVDPKAKYTGVIVYPISFIRLMESNFDGYHGEFIHNLKRGKFITNVKCEVEGLRIKTQWESRNSEDVPGVLTRLDVLFPGVMFAETDAWKIGGVFTCVPIDDSNTWITARYYGDAFKTPVLGSIKKWIWLQYALKWVFREDVRVQKSQTPQETGYGFDHPVVNADKGIIAYWKIWKEYALLEKTPERNIRRVTNKENHYPPDLSM